MVVCARFDEQHDDDWYADLMSWQVEPSGPEDAGRVVVVKSEYNSFIRRAPAV